MICRLTGGRRLPQREPDPYTEQERDAILAYYRANRPPWAYAFVYFRFWTGTQAERSNCSQVGKRGSSATAKATFSVVAALRRRERAEDAGESANDDIASQRRRTFKKHPAAARRAQQLRFHGWARQTHRPVGVCSWISSRAARAEDSPATVLQYYVTRSSASP